MELDTRIPALQEEEINKIAREYKLTFDCPHCHKEINETHFGEREKAFQLIKEKVRKIAEEEFNSQKNLYNQQWLEQIEKNRIYENFQGVLNKTKTIEELTNKIKKLEEDLAETKLKSEKELAKATSSDAINELKVVKELKEERDRYKKENEGLKLGNQPEIQILKKTIEELNSDISKLKSSEEVEKLERVKELKEKVDKYQKENEEKEKRLSELKSSEYIENLERVKKLVEENNELRNQNQSLRDQGRMSKKKGENFEQYIFEELNRVFDNKDKISKITQMGEKADFLQEVLTENGEQVAGRIIYEVKNEKKWKNEWVSKLENDMANKKADFGIIIAICENGKPLRCLDPRKKIYVSDDENFIYIAKIMRDSLIQKHNYLKKGDTDEDSKEKRIKNFEEWISSKFPQYLSRLENELTELKKSSYHADKITEITHNAETNIRKIILEEVRIEISNL